MKRVLALLLLSAVVLLAQHEGGLPQAEISKEARPGAHPSEAGHEDDTNWTMWKFANFAILAAVLGYLIGKYGAPVFRARGEDIRRGITDAEAQRKGAEARMAEIERRMTSLEGEIATLRANARQEMAAEADRIREQTSAQLAKVQSQAEQEIASAAKAAQQALKEYSAEIALQLAEHKIRNRLTPDIQRDLVSSFAAHLNRNGGR